MIHSAISHITGRLSQHLKGKLERHEDIVAASNIFEQDGSVCANIDNKVIVSLINIKKETTPGSSPNGITSNSSTFTTYPPLHINLYLMFSAHFNSNNYSEALKLISYTISFFQANPFFDHYNSPDLDKDIDKLIMDIVNLDWEVLSNVWSMMGAKYVPSVLYEMRMITFDSESVKKRESGVKTPGVGISRQD